MAVTGAKPKPEGTTRHRVPPVHEWVDVQDVPYEGPVPNPGTLPARTKQWWAVVTRMPHCALWDESDWQFAVHAAHVHAEWVKTKRAGFAVEVRQLSEKLGMTADARRDLRIRYVPAGTVEEAEQPTAIDEYRNRLA